VRNVLARPDCAEFCFPHLDTHIRVEVSDECVTIRASRDTFSSSRRESFIRNLVSEGFIPERYRWSTLGDPGISYGGICWLVDYTWMRISEDVLAISRRFVLRLFAGSIVLALFLLELGVAGFMGDSRIATGIERNSASSETEDVRAISGGTSQPPSYPTPTRPDSHYLRKAASKGLIPDVGPTSASLRFTIKGERRCVADE